mmetsp:Transcript_13488/g.37882  ORF Transcript_13488/g.37882 Transcript_13488/m.37882 type:complete len:395 (-) Transcript_13488:777-1961(-)
MRVREPVHAGPDVRPDDRKQLRGRGRGQGVVRRPGAPRSRGHLHQGGILRGLPGRELRGGVRQRRGNAPGDSIRVRGSSRECLGVLHDDHHGLRDLWGRSVDRGQVRQGRGRRVHEERDCGPGGEHDSAGGGRVQAPGRNRWRGAHGHERLLDERVRQQQLFLLHAEEVAGGHEDDHHPEGSLRNGWPRLVRPREQQEEGGLFSGGGRAERVPGGQELDLPPLWPEVLHDRLERGRDPQVHHRGQPRRHSQAQLDHRRGGLRRREPVPGHRVHDVRGELQARQEVQKDGAARGRLHDSELRRRRGLGHARGKEEEALEQADSGRPLPGRCREPVLQPQHGLFGRRLRHLQGPRLRGEGLQQNGIRGEAGAACRGARSRVRCLGPRAQSQQLVPR